MASKRVSLTTKHLETKVGKELLSLSNSIKADGVLTRDEISKLVKWLNSNKASDVPAVVFLYSAVKRILADKVISPSEMQELHLALEKVLPPSHRKAAVKRRKEIEKAAKQKERDVKRSQREDEKRRKQQERASRPRQFYSKIAGVTARNENGSRRQSIIRAFVSPNQELIVRREPYNPYDKSAISLWIRARTLLVFTAEKQIGYLNVGVAEQLAPHIDSGGWVKITVSDVTGGGLHYYGVNILIEYGGNV